MRNALFYFVSEETKNYKKAYITYRTVCMRFGGRVFYRPEKIDRE